MKTTKHWLATIAMLLCSVSVNAHDFEVDGIYYKITSSTDLTVAVTYKGNSYSAYANEYSGDIVIPSIVSYGNKTYDVTSVESYAFHSCSSLTSIVLSEGVINIRDFAFNSCSTLRSITLPESLKSIGDFVFGSCNSLSEVRISSMEAWCGVVFDSNPLQYAKNLYLDGVLVTRLVIPEGVTSIGESAFDGCTCLTSVSVPESVTEIGESAFSGCTNLTSINIPKRVTKINRNTFYNCTSLKMMSIPEGVTSIGSYAFYRCSQLSSISIPSSVTSIDAIAFDYCDNLTKVNINSIDAWCKIKFGSSLLNKTGNLYLNGVLVTSIVIPEDITSIGKYTFYNCSKLQSVTISNSVIAIESSAFSGCGGLVNMVMPESVKTIGDKAFYNCAGLTSLVIPKSVTELGYQAFGGCGGIKEVYIEDCVTPLNCNLKNYSYYNDYFFEDSPIEYLYVGRNLSGYTFSYAYGDWRGTLRTVEFGNGITSIPNSMFDSCYGLTEVVISNSIKDIGKNAFYYCNLTKLILGENVETIGQAAFRGADIKDINIPNNVTSIGGGVFGECHYLERIVIPSSVEEIGEGVFNYCYELESIIVDEDNMYYDSRENCNAIIETNSNTLIAGCSKTIIPNDVISIAANAFYGCKELTSIIIPKNVISIGGYAFYCNGGKLEKITCKAKNPPTCSKSTFSGVSKSIPVHVPESSVEAYRAAEGWSEFTNFVAIPEVNISVLDTQEGLSQLQEEDFDNLTYTRTFNNTNWQALYVPFEIPYENIKDDFDVAYIYDTRQYDNDGDGVKDETVIESFVMKSGVLNANYPYLIRAKEVGEKTITVSDATLYATEEVSIDCSSVFDTYTFTGTYSRMSSEELPQGEGYYALSGGVWRPVAEGSSLGAFRFYLKVDSRSSSTVANARCIRMRVMDEDGNVEGTTDIGDAQLSMDETPAEIYDLQGRCVENPTKGIYVVNGKKVMIK